MVTPLSFPQRRMVELAYLHQATGALHLSAALRLRGPLELTELQDALGLVIGRQAGLHVTLAPEGLRERPPAPIVLERFEAADAARAIEIHDAEARRPFELAAGPLIRAAVVRHAAHDHLLLITAHHLVFDGRSFGILWRDLAEVLAARAASRPVQLSAVKPYRELAREQQERLAAGDYRGALARKRAKLAGMPTLALPLDHPRPPLLGIRRGMVARALGPDARHSLAQRSEQLAIPPMTLRLAAVLLLLRHETGQEDVSIGLSDERNRTPAFEHTMGLFHDVDALRVVLPATLTGGEAIARVHAAVAEAERDAVPAHLLLEALGQPLDPSRGPLVQAFFGVLPDRKASWTAGALVLEPERVVRTPFADLAFIASEGADERIAIIYNEDVFERSTIERMLANLEIQVTASPTQLACPIVSSVSDPGDSPS